MGLSVCGLFGVIRKLSLYISSYQDNMNWKFIFRFIQTFPHSGRISDFWWFLSNSYMESIYMRTTRAVGRCSGIIHLSLKVYLRLLSSKRKKIEAFEDMFPFYARWRGEGYIVRPDLPWFPELYRLRVSFFSLTSMSPSMPIRNA